MFNPLSAGQSGVLREAIVACGLEQWENEITARAQAAIGFEAVAAMPKPQSSDVSKPVSRFGGLPDVPLSWDWPQNTEFFAQLDCAELAGCDFNRLLPPSGLLSFFASRQVIDSDAGLL